LDVQGRALWVNPQGDQLRCTSDGALTQFSRILLNGNSVQVRDEVKSVEAFLQVNPLLERTEVITQVIRVSRWLDTRQDTIAWLRGWCSRGCGSGFSHIYYLNVS